VTVTGATAGSKVNTTGTVTSTNGGDGNTATDTLTVISPPSIAKTFSPDSITVGNISSLQFTITNSNVGTALTGVAFTDTLPAGVTVTSAISSECGGTLTVTAPGSITLSSGSIASSSNCVFSVTVTGATVGVKVNTSGTVSSTNGGTGNTATDTLTVSAPLITDPAVTKSVSPSTAAIGDTVTFTLFVSNGGPGDAQDVELVDTIPAFLEITLVATVPSPVSTLISGNTVTIDFGTVAPSDTYTVTITTVVRDSAIPQAGTNTADVSTSSPESDTDNNSDSVPITIVVASPPLEAPETGFAPNRITSIPLQPSSKIYETYGEMKLEIPALNVEMSIVGIPKDSDGWDVSWLADQAGYLAGTAFPTWSGNSVITGHNTLASGINGPFAQLEELEYGDQIVVSAWGMRHIYEVREEDWVRPTDSSIFRHEERSWITLLTCDDWDEQTETYRMRHLVRAVLMNIEQVDSETPRE
jgi:LPXTG-site transpeptidase (sortase) family protein